jgi:hypothetical protein
MAGIAFRELRDDVVVEDTAAGPSVRSAVRSA